MLFSNGSLILDKGVRAAAYHIPSATLLPACLGAADDHTVYEAELVGIRLAAESALAHLGPLQRNFWFFIDNQASIKALSRNSPPHQLSRCALQRVKRSTASSSPRTTPR